MMQPQSPPFPMPQPPFPFPQQQRRRIIQIQFIPFPPASLHPHPPPHPVAAKSLILLPPSFFTFSYYAKKLVLFPKMFCFVFRPAVTMRVSTPAPFYFCVQCGYLLSYSKSAAATEAFKDSTSPDIGIFTRTSARADVSFVSPFDSFPIRTAVRSL